MFQMLQDEPDGCQDIKPKAPSSACQEASIIVKHNCNILGVSLSKLLYSSYGTYVILFYITDRNSITNIYSYVIFMQCLQYYFDNSN